MRARQFNLNSALLIVTTVVLGILTYEVSRVLTAVDRIPVMEQQLIFIRQQQEEERRERIEADDMIKHRVGVIEDDHARVHKP